MSIHQDIIKNRRRVKAGIVLGFTGAIALTIIRLANTDPVTIGETLGSVALGPVLATPATLALLSLDRRPTLLPAAALTALVTVMVGAVVLPVALATAFIWYRAWAERPVAAATSTVRKSAHFGLAFLLLAATLTLFVHVDPVCVQRLTDGTERSVDAASRGLTTGWAFGSVGTTGTTSSSSISGDVAEEVCTSNTIVLGEALASLALTAIVLESGRRWPQGLRMADGGVPAGEAQDPKPLSAERT